MHFSNAARCALGSLWRGENRDKVSRFGRYALGFCAAAMLAACGGGSGGPLSPSPARVVAERTHVRYSVLYRFKGAPGDGYIPVAGLLNVKGTLYGTTFLGGANNDGIVFSITPSGEETVLYSFKGGSGDGENPYAGLLNVNGTLYGTTVSGGANGDGTVFKLTTSGSETVLYSFKGGSGDGEDPYAGLLNVKGTLYGTTGLGGTNADGTVFSITTSGAETLLYSFKGGSADGEDPDAGLINVNGTFYGTTQKGGAHSDGTVFSITPSGAETLLYSFKGGSGDGEDPYAGLLNVKGTLYGTTQSGGASDDGTVFEITTSGTETVLYSFKGSSDGQYPYASLLNLKGTLYGTTGQGGGSYRGGTAFAVTTSGKETVLHIFGPGSGDGENPNGGLINVKGTLYGTTEDGGVSNQGTVFSLSP
jgi:uncharacterized repeat protein (TIGR03803 family)